jgi:hypothetical protein
MRIRIWFGLGMLLSSLAVLVAPALAMGSEPFAVKATMRTTGPVEVEEVIQGRNGRVRRFRNPSLSYTQAGGHPYALTTLIEFPTELVGHDNDGDPELAPVEDPKDIVTDLPQGLLGNPQSVPRCPIVQVLDSGKKCPAGTQIGEFVWHLGNQEYTGPIYNLTPEAGQSAEFGMFTSFDLTILLTAHVVRNGNTYALTVVSNEIPMTELWYAELTFWGVPAAASHDVQRGLVCNNIEGLQTCSGGGEASGEPEIPFLTMPTDCTAGPLTFGVTADSWEHPGVYTSASSTIPPVTGCQDLAFHPGVEVRPDTLRADEPVGLGVNLTVPQDEGAGELFTPELRNTVLTLPEGLSISPGVVDGVQACNESGPEGINFSGPESEETGLNGEPQLAPGHCPDASIVGEAEAITPLLGVPVKGHVYLARPQCGGQGEEPCSEQDALDGRLYRLYLELGGTGAFADTGVNLKVAFDTEANPATGQLTTVVKNTPPLPFSELHVRLNGGPRAPLDNPAVCGPARTTTDLTPWSAPGLLEGVSMPGTPDATPSSFYNVDLAGDGEATPCPGLPLAPGFVAGTVSPQAGQFSAFTMNLSRGDREQYIKGIQLHTPPGLSGVLADVPLCEEPQADNGHCPAASKIGTTRVASGAGSHPFEIEGNVYLTRGYEGAPFGLSIVTDAVAGPFNLGLVVVRARIDVNPDNATLTVTTNETGPYAVPQILDGVPLRLKRITVNIDRPGFMFNPTNCGAPGQPGTQQITAVISGSEQAKASVQSQFAVGGCKSLAFKPSFTVSTSAHTSRLNGATLDAKVSYPPDSMGNEANISYVKVELPKQLPARLTTLQKACTAQTFETNPANCPQASVVGIVRASTPLLPVGLSGPVYFVSHGGEAFPSLIVVLQGDGVRVDLTGTTFISKAGITSSTFKTVPDVPVNTFELYLPEGKYSALTTDGNLCASQGELKMPTEFVAQNGMVMKQATQITVTGCPHTKKTTRHKQKKRMKTGSSSRGRTGK